MYKNVLLLAFVLNVILSFGQPKKDTSFQRLTKFPVISFDVLNLSNSDYSINKKKGGLNLLEYTTQIQFALPIKKKRTYLFNSIKYSYSDYQLSFANKSSSSKLIQTVKYNIGIIQVLPKRWRLAINFIPTLSSDFNENLNNDDFNMYASIFATKRYSANCEYGIGLAYSSYVSLFESPFVIPLVSLIYKKNYMTTHIIFPYFIVQRFDLSDNTSIGIKATIDGKLSNIKPDNYDTKLKLNGFSNSTILLGPEFQQKLFGSIYMNASIGIQAFNKYIIHDDENKTELSFKTSSNLYFNFGIKLLK